MILDFQLRSLPCFLAADRPHRHTSGLCPDQRRVSEPFWLAVAPPKLLPTAPKSIPSPARLPPRLSTPGPRSGVRDRHAERDMSHAALLVDGHRYCGKTSSPPPSSMLQSGEFASLSSSSSMMKDLHESAASANALDRVMMHDGRAQLLEQQQQQQQQRHLAQQQHQHQQPRRRPPPPESNGSVDSSSQSILQSVTNSQESSLTAASDQAVTPPASDASGAIEGDTGRLSGQRDVARDSEKHFEDVEMSDQLMQLSTIAAAQDRITSDFGAGYTRKRRADGEVKIPRGSMSPVKGHARTTSAISIASNGSTIGEVSTRRSKYYIHGTNQLKLSAELRTRLSYAMVKVNHGWQSRSLDEVESLASQAVSPSSSTSTVQRRRADSSASPHLALTAAVSRDTASSRPKSYSPPHMTPSKPTLAPPAPIQPSSSMPAPTSNPRRNSNPRYNPTMLSHSHSTSHSSSPRTPGQPMRLDTNQSSSQGSRLIDPILFPPHQHQNMREQDAIESLLFMSSPGNSANLKHAFSPTGSPGPQYGVMRTAAGRHALPGGPRKVLPSQRPAYSHVKPGLDRSPGMLPPESPMDIDSPQRPYYNSNRGTPKRRAKGGSNHMRGALSLPTGLGVVHGTARKILRDEDIERMLDRAGAEAADSSDDEEIQLPPGRGSIAGVMGVRG